MKDTNEMIDTKGYQYGSGYGVDAVLNCTIPKEERPFCTHGPAILFERYFKDKESRKFFACSACRNRKECPFFQWYDEKSTPGKKLIQEEIKKTMFTKNKSARKLAENDHWCFDCSYGYTDTAESEENHDGHDVKFLSKENIDFPSQFLNPSESKKAKAQYFFDETTCQFFLTTVKRLQYKYVICIGTPRLFEVLRANGISVILLDIDTRFQHFHSPEEFLVYNMYTHFFFDKGRREKRFQNFISKCIPEETIIILDPPFGGLLNVLENTLSKIWNLYGVESLATIMVFPYFLESHVTQNLPCLLMHDYKVSYSNHPTYHNAGKQVRGSPVRIYTNIPGEKLSFPKEDYKFCKTCQRYIYKANRHCKECNACTSKDGRTYVHCNDCNKCVKPTNVHCTTCQTCKPLNHPCGANNKSGCHICGEFDHKRRDCPSKLGGEQEVSKAKLKRKSSLSSKVKGKKRKKVLTQDASN